MNGTFSLAKRNFLCFFRDRSAVFFSLMAVLIVVMLYLLFLRNVLVQGYPSFDGMFQLIDAWVLSGILGIVSVTASAGSLQVMIDDKTSGKDRDVLMTALSRPAIAAGYVFSTFLVGFVMGLLTLAIAVVYLAVTGCPMSVYAILASLALTIPSALSGSIIVYAMTSFLKTPAAFSGFFTVISVLIGFLTGIYMPFGSMPSAMQVVGALVPATHMASVFRQVLGGDALDHVFSGAPESELTEFRADMGFDLSIGGFSFDPMTSMLYVIGATALFFVIAVAMMKRDSGKN